jgi:hypothetical protein
MLIKKLTTATVYVLTFWGALLVAPTTTYALNLTQFTVCIGSSGGTYGSLCQLDAMPGQPYAITNTLTIGRSNIIISGTVLSSMSDTTLQRTPALSNLPIMQAASGVSNITIESITFDGNRAGVGLRCVLVNTPGSFTIDLELQQASHSMLSGMQVINSPWISVAAGDSLNVQNSGFYNGRVCAIWGVDVSVGGHYDQLYVYNDTFEYYGTGAVSTSSNSTIGGSTFYSNHDEFTYGYIGGQLFASGTQGALLQNVTIQNNTLDGNYAAGNIGYPAGPFGCPIPQNSQMSNNIGDPVSSGGLEVTLTNNVTLTDNRVRNHGQAGIGLDSITGIISITQRGGEGINHSNWHGIWFHGAPSGLVSLNGVVSANNQGYGIEVDMSSGATGPLSLTFSRAGICLSPNGPNQDSTHRLNVNGSGVTVNSLPPSDSCPKL